MSSPLAIAVVSAVIMDLLHNGLVDHDLSAVGSFKVSAKPPDRVFSGTDEGNQLNLFLYQVTANAAWRNVGLPSHDGGGGRLTNPPLALDLHYLLTAYGQQDLNAEILLGYAMELLHDRRVISRLAIREALSSNSPIVASLIPADAQGRTAADLADQVELIKITPQYLAADDLAKLWSAMQSRYRPSVGYQVSVVLIEGLKPTKSALPVLTQGKQDLGPAAHGSLLPPIPTLLKASVVDAERRTRAAVQLGDTILLTGFNLAGHAPTAIFRHRALETPIERPATLAAGGTDVTVKLPAPHAADAANWRAGVYTVALRITDEDDRVVTTNETPFAMAPTIVSTLPLAVARVGGAAKVTVKVAPPVHPGQRAALLVGGDEHAMPAPKQPTDSVEITIEQAAATATPLPLRVRIDGVETVIVPDRAAAPPVFDPKQSITIT